MTMGGLIILIIVFVIWKWFSWHDTSKGDELAKFYRFDDNMGLPKNKKK